MAKAKAISALDLRAVTNADLWNSIRAKYPKFRDHTSEVTQEFFTERTFEEIKATDPEIFNDFWLLSVRVYLDRINVSMAKDPLSGFGESSTQAWGGITQRMAIDSLKPVSPAYRNLEDYSTVDPFVIRKAKTSERFYSQNFDYQSLITIPDSFQFKTIFVAERGMSEFMSGLMQALENGYINQRYLNKLEVLNAGLNSTDFPLQDTQEVLVPMAPAAGGDGYAPTRAQLANFILAIANILTTFDTTSQISAYNQAGFLSTQEKSRLRLLVRAGFKNDVKIKLLPGIFNPDNFNLDIEVIEVANFGGLTPFTDAAFTTPAYPVYSPLGDNIGWATTEGATVPDLTEDQIFWQDPNADVYAILADNGWMFATEQNPYTVEPIRNPRGMYTNFWANSPGNAIHYDRYYNFIVFRADPDATIDPDINVYVTGGTIETTTA